MRDPFGEERAYKIRLLMIVGFGLWALFFIYLKLWSKGVVP